MKVLQLLGQLAAVGALGQMGMQLGLLLERERPVQPGAEEKLIFFAWVHFDIPPFRPS